MGGEEANKNQDRRSKEISRWGIEAKRRHARDKTQEKVEKAANVICRGGANTLPFLPVSQL